jgi:lipid A disaccharide synthetase
VLEADYDLLLSIFPFEKKWYAEHAPKLRVEFVGHPIVDRSGKTEDGGQRSGVLLLPGSRKSELAHHLPVLLGALKIIRGKLPSVKAKMVLPDESLQFIRGIGPCGISDGFDGNSHDGVRVFWRAGGDTL